MDKPPTIFHLETKAEARYRLAVGPLVADYRKRLAPDRLRLLNRFTLKDLAFKAVGVGSVGTFCCVALFMTLMASRCFFSSSRLSIRYWSGSAASLAITEIRAGGWWKDSR